MIPLINLTWYTVAPYITAAFTILSCCIGSGIGQGLIGYSALQATNQQPHATEIIVKTGLLGMALLETSALAGMFIATLLLATNSTVHSITTISPTQSLATWGITLALCVPGIVIGIISAWPAQAACLATARQPFFSYQISRFMLLTQSLIQTPILFALIIAFFIQQQISVTHTFGDAYRLLASGLCIGLGSIGPAIGLASFAHQACNALGTNPKAYYKLFYLTIIGESIIETPIILSFICSSFMLFGLSHVSAENIHHGVAYMASALALGLGTFGPGIALGKIACAAAHQIALKPELYDIIFKTCMLGLALVESCVIYAAIISTALLLLP